MANFPSTYFGVHSAFHAGYKYPYLFFCDITAAQNPKVTLYLQPHTPQKRAVTVLSCPKCDILKQGVPEDLDEFAEEILEEM